MKRLQGAPLMYIGIMALMLVIISSSLAMPYFESKVLPLVFSSFVFILAAAGLGQELRSGKAASDEDEEDKGETGKGIWLGYLVNMAWVGGFILAIYLLGFIVAVPVFVLFYMKRLGTRWLTAVIASVSTTLLIWGVFEVVLKLVLYRGLLWERLLS